MFLVKMPFYVAKNWSSLPPGAEIGRLALPTVLLSMNRSAKEEDEETEASRKRKRGEEANLLQGLHGKMTLTNPAFDDFPKQHSLLFKPAHHPPLHCFTESPDGKLAIEGVIHTKLECVQELTPEYRSLCKERTIAENTKSRTSQVFSADKLELARARPQPKRLKKEDMVQDKMTRMPRQDLIDMIFSCFERQEYWTLKHLRDVTKQPTAWLKEILSELCLYNKRGEHKNTFELRPEYKHSSNATKEEK